MGPSQRNESVCLTPTALQRVNNEESKCPKRQISRTWSELSRHTTDTGYRSVTRSRRNSFSLDDSDDDFDGDHCASEVGTTPQAGILQVSCIPTRPHDEEC